jgi:uncharacterized protein (DUF362 family)
MEDFLRIQTVFGNQTERTIKALNHICYDRAVLRTHINKILGDKSIEEKIKGKRILIKPNWVRHSIVEKDEICLRTHDSFVLATLEVLLDMKPMLVTLGDAPIQGCKWDRMISESFIKEINKLSKGFKVPIQIIDFRRRIYNAGKNNPESGIRPLSDYVVFDLSKDSFLEPVTEPGKSKFRVTNYDPDRMSSAHSPGIHKYCIIKEFFEADFILSLPKIKTHQKTGITGALKNLVGINGDKDFLPHHRIGGTKLGGDCYPGRSYLRYWSELALDKSNRRQGSKSFWFWQKLSSLLWKISFPGHEHHSAAGWFGNDTAWRMVLDINRIAVFGKAGGIIDSKPQRKIFSLCDGLIAGEGNGPLNPEPLPLGIISFTNNSLVNDIAMATLMRFDYMKIPLLKASEELLPILQCEIFLNTEKIKIEDLENYSISTHPPDGWIKYFTTK